MKQVTIVVPKGNINISSITGAFEILTYANEYWRKMGNESRMEVRIAGFVPERKLDVGLLRCKPLARCKRRAIPGSG